MEKFVIYCKSYRGDLERVKLLSETIEKHNKDNIPFIISVPEKDKYLSDFMASEDVPYMVMHSHNVFWEWWDRYSYKFSFDARESYEKEYLSIKEHLGNGGKVQHYGPAPFIWDTKVWKWLNDTHGITNVFKKHFNELKWYGEAAIASGANFYPCAPLFACMHYKEQYKMYKDNWDYQEKHFHNQYLGIVMQSNWDAPLKF